MTHAAPMETHFVFIPRVQQLLNDRKFFTMSAAVNFSSAKKGVKLLLHFDVNKTIIMRDKGINVKEMINNLLVSTRYTE